jgi:hypothetical protein
MRSVESSISSIIDDRDLVLALHSRALARMATRDVG